ncbi:cellular tumor antigen p53 isoform X1 [Drosophila tropicalis]|uniref:cellular tumor antigen p53 isoform X1 n=1 Tax=Drosophila tropicalis TaxID=46794 RepID=UPI0035ABF676
MYIAQSMSWIKASDSEAEEEFQEATNEASVGSVGTTVQETADTGAEVDAEIVDEPLAYLQGLNSGNLMQFSQQSVLREMMLQDIKPQNTLPKLEDHNVAGYEFSMVLEEPRKSHWLYSPALNKLYIRMNKTFNVDVQFKPKFPIQPLNLRVFLCFLKDVSGPVLRCQNHISTEPLSYNNAKVRENILRCENPNTIYCGTAQGKGISERYSVLVPLNMSRSNNHSYMRQTLALKFACQNSCFGRKETSLIFCLENSCGDILGQQVLEVKICTCPKRDRNAEERQLHDKKRKASPSLAASDYDEDECDNDSIDTKRAKRRRRSHSYQPDVKQEDDSMDSASTEQSLPTDWHVKRTSNGDYQLVLTCPKKELLVQSIESMFRDTAAAILRSPTKGSKLHKYATNLSKLKENALKLP